MCRSNHVIRALFLLAQAILAQDFALAATRYVKPGGDGSRDGSSWDNAAASIQAAVDASGAGGEVWVAAGTYKATIDPVVDIKADVAVYGGFAGNETLRTQRTWSARPTIIDGETTRQCVRIATNATLDGFTVRRGKKTKGDGGGIYNDHGTVTNCTVTACASDEYFNTDTGHYYGGNGGGIYSLDGTVSNCTVTSSATSYCGAGIYSSGGVVSGCTVINNHTQMGAGIYCENGTVTGCIATRNYGLSGSGICAVSSVVTSCTATFNNGFRGGGIYNAAGTVTRCNVTDNVARGAGAGIYNIASLSAAVVSNCLIARNYLEDNVDDGGGGGVKNRGTSATLENCMIVGNAAESYGGGVNNGGRVIGCVISGNIAFAGGGVWNGGAVINCTITDNSNFEGSMMYGGGGVEYAGPDATVTNTIAWRNTPFDILGKSISHSCFGEAHDGADGNIRANPRFVSRAGADPASWDLRLASDSPCIDAGTTQTRTFPAKDNLGNPTTQTISLPAIDILGNPRPGGDGKICMGAYESPDPWTPGLPAPTVVLYVSPSGNGADGRSWTKAYQSITTATAAASTDDVYEIRAAAGTYREGHMLFIFGRVNLLGGWSGSSANPDQRDIAVYKTIIDGNNGWRCVKNSGWLDGLWVQNGWFDYNWVTSGVENNGGLVTRCVVTRHRNSGLYNEMGTVKNCTIADNSLPDIEARAGSGVANAGGTISDCTISGNVSNQSVGFGAVCNTNPFYFGVDMTSLYQGVISNCVITGNSSVSSVGAIYNDWSTVNNCTITSNSAVNSVGGVYNDHGSVAGCVFAGNSAGKTYGGVHNKYGTVANCTVVGNTAGETDGGVYSDNGAVTNCIVWRNYPSDLTQSAATVAYNCFGEAILQPGSNMRANPRFVSATSSDPRTWDLRLNSDSPCIDMGTTATANLPKTDIVGNPRPGADGRVCMGAYESADGWVTGIPAPPTALYVSPVGSGTDGRDWTKAFKTITRATQAVTQDDLYEIRVAAATYPEAGEVGVAPRVTLSGGWSGNPLQPDQRDLTIFKSILDGSNAHRCVFNRGILDGMWIQNGRITLAGNAGMGGGIYNLGGLAKNCTVTSNYADQGGGIYNAPKNSVVTNCTIRNNAARVLGGGIFNQSADGPATVEKCVISDNRTSGTGGGVYNRYQSATLTDCVITKNSANSNRSGGVYLEYASMANCTLTSNTGAIYISNGNVRNCIAWRNTSGAIPEISTGYGFASVQFSCVRDAVVDNVHFSGMGNIDDDPMFVDGTDGGDGFDLQLQSGSPCIDKGFATATTDLLGVARPQGAGCDMGAYEWVDPTPGMPANPTPADGATGISVSPYFSWTASDRAKTYDVRLWKESQTKPTSPTLSGVTSPHFTPAANLDWNTRYCWQVIARNATASATGPIWAFRTDSVKIVWDPIASQQIKSVPVSVRLVARSGSSDAPLTNFTGPVSLEAFTVLPALRTIGSGSETWDQIISSYKQIRRTQSIYLPEELNAVAGPITSLALDVSQVPGRTLNNFTIRMKHTLLRTYSGTISGWEGVNSGWTTVYQANETISSTGWVTFNFTTPFNYNGTDPVMIDFSFKNTSWTTGGACRYTQPTGSSRTLYSYASASDDPLYWYQSYPSPKWSLNLPNIRLGVQQASSGTVTPTQTGAFVGGVWDGQVSVGAVATNITLRARFQALPCGDSNKFNVIDNRVTLTYLAGPNGSLSGAATQTVNYGANGTPVEAVPAAGYRFVRWNDGLACNPRVDTADANMTVTAIFEPKPVTPEKLRVFSISRTGYTTDTLQTGKLVYSDRTLTFKGDIPAAYRGQLYIRTRNGDKDLAQSWSFRVNRPATVFVGLARSDKAPSWLSTWQKLPDTLATSDSNSTRILYMRKFQAGQITLGGNWETGLTTGVSMYSVIVLPDQAGVGDWANYE